MYILKYGLTSSPFLALTYLRNVSINIILTWRHYAIPHFIYIVLNKTVVLSQHPL